MKFKLIVSILILLLSLPLVSKKAFAASCTYPTDPSCVEVSMDFNNNTSYSLNVYYHVLAGSCSGGATSNPADGVNCIDLSGQQAIYSLGAGSSIRRFWFDNAYSQYYVWWWANYAASGAFCVDPLDQAAPVPVPGINISQSTSNISCTYPPPPTPTPTIAAPPASPCNASSTSCTGGTANVTFNWTQNGAGYNYEIWWTGSGGTIAQGPSSSYSGGGFAPNNPITMNVRAYLGSNIGPTCSTNVTTATCGSYACSGACGTSSSLQGQACTTTTGGAGTYQWDGQPSGASTTCQTNPNTYCYVCQASATTATTAPVATATTAPSSCTTVTSCGVCCSPNTCLTDGTSTWCGADPWAPTPVPGGGGGGGGFVIPPTPAPPTLSGTVFYDTNGNGVQDAGESGAGGVTVMAYDTSGADNQITTTDSSGNYSVTVTFYTSTYTVTPILSFGMNYIVIPSYRSVMPPATGVNFGLWQGNTINGSVFLDNNGNGTKDAGEGNYTSSAITVTATTGNCADGIDNDGDGRIDTLDARCHWDGVASNAGSYQPTYNESSGSSTNTYTATANQNVWSANGNYTVGGMQNGTYTVKISNPPAGYTLTNPNLQVAVTGGETKTANLGMRLPVPSCSGGLLANPTTVNPGGTATLSVTSCTNVPTPPPTPFSWTPDTSGNNPPPTIGGQTDSPPGAPTSSTTTWTAPSCPTTNSTYTPRVTVGTSGNTVSYTTSITVPATYSVTTNVRSVVDTSACTSSSGTPYSNGGTGANVNITNSSTVNQNQTTSAATGATSFTCLPSGNYQVTMQVPSGYVVTGRTVSPAAGTNTGSNGVSFTANQNQTVTFCIAPIVPWFQTDRGDVRFLNLSNPVPPGKYGSTDATFPGIYYSSNSNANLGFGAASVKNWVINNEYSYNADTENRNGGVSYDFYKQKTKQDGVSVTSLTPGTFDQSQITASGVYEAAGDLTINAYTHVPGRRVVLLVDGNVTINSPITIPVNQGVFILAAKGNITVAKTVGTNTASSTTTNLDGYYSAQGSIVVDGDTCTDGTTSDLRLNVGGALIANALKPFSTSGTGTVQNKRSLCGNGATYPSLFVATRPDFLTQLTDFYKTSYTKWQEVNP